MDTLIDLKNKIESSLRDAGIGEAGLEATLLVERHSGIRRYEFAYADAALADQERLVPELERRRKREPLAYIEGHKAFYGIDMAVNPDVLIPRQETEIVVDTVLEILSGMIRPRVLDIGTGSGAIAAAIAMNIPLATIIACDASVPALAVAKNNMERLGLSERVHIIASDMFSSLSSAARFDVIVSNPPYIATEDISRLEDEIHFEPKLALDGGFEGCDFHKRIIKSAAEYLRSGGSLVLEIGQSQSETVVKSIRKTEAYMDITILPDYAGIERIIRCRKS